MFNLVHWYVANFLEGYIKIDQMMYYIQIYYTSVNQVTVLSIKFGLSVDATIRLSIPNDTS